MRRTDLLRAAGRVAGLLGTDNCALVGGLAVGAHGYVRATRDVDFVTKLALAEVRERLRDDGIPAVLTRGDPLEGDFPCVKGTVDGVRVDVLPPLVPIDWARATEVKLGGKARLRVVDLDGLLRLKLHAGGPRDLMDVAALALRHPELEARASEYSRAYGLEDKLTMWLTDPRLKADVAETRSDRTLEQVAPPLPPRKRSRRAR